AYDPDQKYDGLDIMVEQKAPDLVTVRALDQSNREVRILYAGMLASGKWDFQWDGKGDNGQPAGPGQYQIQVQSGKEILSKQINIQGEPLADQTK
ncbi:MAG TPA: FlgD immunoglobulin-like domain containing protein, partial [bacterium]|nr:FlgD immunoglobulin-like domain containing protein [bacterium]